MPIYPLAAWAAVLTVSADLALAQPPMPPDPTVVGQSTEDEDRPAAAAPVQPPAAELAPAESKRRACRLEARERGLRGYAADGHVAVCIAEARLECTKQAVAQELAKRERNAFVRECLGQPERSRQD